MSFTGGSIAQAALISGLDSGKVAQTAYDAKVALLDAADASASGRLTALESDLSGRVQAEIDAKVAQTVFDSLASELRSADSALTAAVATKVATITQAAVDEAQNSVIATKASITGVNNALNNLVNAFNDEIIRLDGVDASKVAMVDYDAMVAGLQGVDSNHEARLVDMSGRVATCEGRLNAQVDPHLSDLDAKVAAMREFILVLLQTYTITKPTGGSYAYTGVVQNLL